MSQASVDTEILGQLQHEQKTLLDTVDNLRSQGVGEIVQLPQIIVVGDQSSGKSSVLEAISRVRFPVKGGLCTRFATELVLRTSPREEVAVKIRAGNSATMRKPFLFDERRLDTNDLSDLIERSKLSMGIRDDASGFSEDILRIELSGPELPSLTLVDLPGIYRNETEYQSRQGMEIVWRLVEKYMKQENSIILAVVNASYDFSNQGILTEIKRHDPKLERTMGIITNPDRLAPKSIDEGRYVRLVRNQEPLHTLKHGWHVLRNRGPDANDEQGQGTSRTSDKERDDAEKAFFSSGVWGPMPGNLKGVDTLRRKLSRVLTKHIELSLPDVIEDIERKLEARRESKARLGRPRTGPAELRQYLHDIAEQFRDFTRQAIMGAYDDLQFFGDPYADDYPRGHHDHSDARRLRAVVRNLNHAFHRIISSKGARRRIVREHDGVNSDNGGQASASGKNEGSEASNKDPLPLTLYMELYAVEDPEEVWWDDLEEELEIQASVNQSTTFPGSPNDRLALNHFRDQSQRWRSIAEMHLKLVVSSAKTFADLALDHITAGDERTRDALLREYFDPFFEDRLSSLEAKLDELLLHYRNGEALTRETEFIRALSAREKQRLASQVEDVLADKHPTLFNDKPPGVFPNMPTEKMSRSTIKDIVFKALESHTSQFGLEKVVDMAEVYYKMCLRTFTENLIVLAVENCLISQLPYLFTSSMVHGMDEETLEALAAETPEDALDSFRKPSSQSVLASAATTKPAFNGFGTGAVSLFGSIEKPGAKSTSGISGFDASRSSSEISQIPSSAFGDLAGRSNKSQAAASSGGKTVDKWMAAKAEDSSSKPSAPSTASSTPFTFKDGTHKPMFGGANGTSRGLSGSTSELFGVTSGDLGWKKPVVSGSGPTGNSESTSDNGTPSTKGRAR
ncbi:hypothetical protein diail_10060 [Diaporthe ilicicola]|nr:hypothetical protein diail_10060 [Diaporthe ilicicola]